MIGCGRKEQCGEVALKLFRFGNLLLNIFDFQRRLEPFALNANGATNFIRSPDINAVLLLPRTSILRKRSIPTLVLRVADDCLEILPVLRNWQIHRLHGWHRLSLGWLRIWSVG